MKKGILFCVLLCVAVVMIGCGFQGEREAKVETRPDGTVVGSVKTTGAYQETGEGVTIELSDPNGQNILKYSAGSTTSQGDAAQDLPETIESVGDVVGEATPAIGDILND